MKKIKSLISIILIVMIIESCGNSDVVTSPNESQSEKEIQKDNTEIKEISTQQEDNISEEDVLKVADEIVSPFLVWAVEMHQNGMDKQQMQDMTVLGLYCSNSESINNFTKKEISDFSYKYFGIFIDIAASENNCNIYTVEDNGTVTCEGGDWGEVTPIYKIDNIEKISDLQFSIKVDYCWYYEEMDITEHPFLCVNYLVEYVPETEFGFVIKETSYEEKEGGYGDNYISSYKEYLFLNYYNEYYALKDLNGDGREELLVAYSDDVDGEKKYASSCYVISFSDGKLKEFDTPITSSLYLLYNEKLHGVVCLYDSSLYYSRELVSINENMEVEIDSISKMIDSDTTYERNKNRCNKNEYDKLSDEWMNDSKEIVFEKVKKLFNTNPINISGVEYECYNDELSEEMKYIIYTMRECDNINEWCCEKNISSVLHESFMNFSNENQLLYYDEEFYAVYIKYERQYFRFEDKIAWDIADRFDYYIYIGKTKENGWLDGEGIILAPVTFSVDEGGIYTCVSFVSMKNGYPNGEAKQYICDMEGGCDEKSGEVNNGLWNGEIQELYRYENDAYNEYSILIENGILIEQNDGCAGIGRYYDEDGNSVCENRDYVVEDQSCVYGILGFGGVF